MRRPRARLIALVAVVGACSFGAPAIIESLVDAPPVVNEPDAAVIPDAFVPVDGGPCSAPGLTCEGPILHDCDSVGATPKDTLCGWGCSVINGPHCALLQPVGGALSQDDLASSRDLEDKTITATGQTWDTSTGEIKDGVRPPGTGIKNGIEFKVNNGVGIFRFKSLTIQGGGTAILVRGANSLAIAAIDSVTINSAVLDLRGDCAGTNPGPGGFAGGTANASGGGAGAGEGGVGGQNNCSGGGGAGFGAGGGQGGASSGVSRSDGGNAFGDAVISSLHGGAGGGGGGGGTGAGNGGGGGGGIQIVSNGLVHFVGDQAAGGAGINAGGCAGQGGGSKKAGAGGGAGGTILVEAPRVTIDGPGGFSVNGGGGGAGDGGSQGGDALFSTSAASGGGGGGGGGGGAGGARGTNNLTGRSGGDGSKAGGGGGGAVGRIRFNTQSGLITVNNGFLSPSLGDDQTSTTQGLANVK